MAKLNDFKSRLSAKKSKAADTLLDATQKAQSFAGNLITNAKQKSTEVVNKAAEYGITITGPNAAPQEGSGVADLTRETIPEEILVPELVRPDGSQSAPKEYSPVSNVNIEKSSILSQAESSVSDMLSGQLPEDVVEQLMETTAEQGIQTGVLGQAQDFSTANALGLTSLDMVLKGVEASTALGQVDQQRILADAELNSKIDLSNAEMALSYEQLNETIREWDDKMITTMQQIDQQWAGISLQAAEIVSANQRHMHSLMNELVVNDARYEIPGLQEHLSELARFFNISDEAILAIGGITKG